MNDRARAGIGLTMMLAGCGLGYLSLKSLFATSCTNASAAPLPSCGQVIKRHVPAFVGTEALVLGGGAVLWRLGRRREQ